MKNEKEMKKINHKKKKIIASEMNKFVQTFSKF